MAKTFKVLLKEVDFYYTDVEAETPEEAEEKVNEMILAGKVLDTYEGSDSAGYEVVINSADEITE